MASRVPDPGLKPVALIFGGLTDHLILWSISFSITFPITGSSDIGLYVLFFLGIGTIVACFQEDGSIPSFSDRVYSLESCSRNIIYIIYIIIEYVTVSSPGDESRTLLGLSLFR